MRPLKYLSAAIAFIALFALAAGIACAATKTFEREYTYNASEADSKLTCRAIALEQVKRALLEELGTFLISETTVKNMELTLDQITTLSAGVVSTNVVEEKWNGETYWLKARIKANPDDVARAIKDLKGDKQKTKELEDSRRIAKDALAEVERLRAQIAKLEKKNKILEAKAAYKKETNKLTATDWFERAWAHQKAERYKEAIYAYSKAIGLNPEDAYPYLIRGSAYQALQQYNRAIKDYDKAIVLNPEYANAYNNRGTAYKDLEQDDKALADYNKSIELNPQLAMAYSNRGNVYYDLKQYNKAIKDHNKAIELNPQYAAAYNNRGNVYKDLEQDDKALADYNKSIELNPQLAMAYNNRGFTYNILKQYNRAIKDFDKAVTLDPKFAYAYNNRGFTYNILKQYNRAIKDFDKAISLNPEYAYAYYNRGFANINLKQYDRALPDLNKSIKLNPEFADTYNGRGFVYMVNPHKTKEACADFEKACSLGNCEIYNTTVQKGYCK